MNENIKALFQTEKLTRKRLPWLAIVLAIAGQFSYLGLVFLTEMAHWVPGARSYALEAPSDTIVYFVAYTLGVHLFLTWPLTTMAFPSLKNKSRWAQLFIPTVMASLPLLSFAYYLGGIRDLLGFHEALLIVIPAVLLATHFYGKIKEAWLFTAMIVIATFLPFWIVNDVLSHFPVLAAYASRAGQFYFWRVVLPILSTAAIFYLSPANGSDKEGLTSLRWATLVVGAYSLSLFWLLPIAAKWTGEIAEYPVMLRDFGVILFIVVTCFLWRPTRYAYLALRAAALVQLLCMTLWLAWYFRHIRLAYDEVFRLSCAALFLAISAAMLLTLSRHRTDAASGDRHSSL